MRDAGITMLQDFVQRGICLPVIFYIGSNSQARGTPANAFGISDRPDELLNYIVDALGRVRRSDAR